MYGLFFWVVSVEISINSLLMRRQTGHSHLAEKRDLSSGGLEVVVVLFCFFFLIRKYLENFNNMAYLICKMIFGLTGFCKYLFLT